jgi:hypothetical protein
MLLDRSNPKNTSEMISTYRKGEAIEEDKFGLVDICNYDSSDHPSPLHLCTAD